MSRYLCKDQAWNTGYDLYKVRATNCHTVGCGQNADYDEKKQRCVPCTEDQMYDEATQRCKCRAGTRCAMEEAWIGGNGPPLAYDTTEIFQRACKMPVQRQGSCRSCYAFAAVSTISIRKCVYEQKMLTGVRATGATFDAASLLSLDAGTASTLSPDSENEENQSAQSEKQSETPSEKQSEKRSKKRLSLALLEQMNEIEASEISHPRSLLDKDQSEEAPPEEYQYLSKQALVSCAQATATHGGYYYILDILLVYCVLGSYY